jgi:hypothetical protein
VGVGLHPVGFVQISDAIKCAHSFLVDGVDKQPEKPAKKTLLIGLIEN